MCDKHVPGSFVCGLKEGNPPNGEEIPHHAEPFLNSGKISRQQLTRSHQCHMPCSHLVLEGGFDRSEPRNLRFTWHFPSVSWWGNDVIGSRFLFVELQLATARSRLLHYQHANKVASAYKYWHSSSQKLFSSPSSSIKTHNHNTQIIQTFTPSKRTSILPTSNQPHHVYQRQHLFPQVSR
jgi:hypothetical protein